MSEAPVSGRKLVVYTVAAAVSGSNLNIDTMTGDGSDTTLTLSIAPVNENNTQVFFDGVYQSKSNYSISGTTLTFTTAPPNGTAVEVMTFTQTDINVPVDGTITPAKIAAGDFYFDTDTLYIDSTNNNVGIGTSSPNSDTTLTISAANNQIDLISTDNSQASINFVNSGGISRQGFIKYVHDGDFSGNMQFRVAGSERVRIDSSGNLLVGTAATNLYLSSDGSEGIRIASDHVSIAGDQRTLLYLNRQTTDGEILRFLKDGTTVGNIGALSSDIVIGSRNDVGFKIYAPNSDGTSSTIHPIKPVNGAAIDGKMDLGYSGGRFKDLYLSGGAVSRRYCCC